MISAIVLAAGTSSRMGRAKPLVQVGTETLLERVLAVVQRSRVGEVVVVLGHRAGRIRSQVGLDGFTVVVNPDYADGMSTSLQAGLRALDLNSEAFLVVLADQPFVSTNTLDALIDHWDESEAKIFLPTYHGVRGNPVLLDRSLSDAVETISGDQGCRGIFGDHEDAILEVPVEDPGILIDLDTEEQLQRTLDATARGEPLDSLVAEARPRTGHAHSARRQASGRSHRRRRVNVLTVAEKLRSQGEPFALVTVVRAVRPTSGKPGYKALVRPNGRMVGWVGGGCSRSVVIAESLAALEDGQPRLLNFSPEAHKAESHEGVVQHTMECDSGGIMDIFVEPHLPRPQLLIVGDSPLAEALSTLGGFLDYRVVVVSPRSSEDTFPEADQVVTDLDTLGDLGARETYAVVASMGMYDETAVRALVDSEARYIGLVASRKRAGVLLDRMRGEGVPQETLDRVRNPAGLDLFARTQEEIGLSILAEITQIRRVSGPDVESVGGARSPKSTDTLARDLVCGMEVERETSLRATHEGTTYYFCSEGCRTRFLESPEGFVE